MNMTDIEADLMIAKARIAELERELAAADRHGCWENHTTMHGVLGCSECKHVFIYEEWLAEGKWKYCPNCGAKMDKEKNT